VDWTQMSESEAHWRFLVNTVMILRVSSKAGNLVASWETSSLYVFSRKPYTMKLAIICVRSAFGFQLRRLLKFFHHSDKWSSCNNCNPNQRTDPMH